MNIVNNGHNVNFRNDHFQHDFNSRQFINVVQTPDFLQAQACPPQFTRIFAISNRNYSNGNQDQINQHQMSNENTQHLDANKTSELKIGQPMSSMSNELNSDNVQIIQVLNLNKEYDENSSKVPN